MEDCISYISDKLQVKTLFNNFGTMLIFIFYSKKVEQSVEYLK